MFKGSTRIVDLDPSLWMWRLWILWRHKYDVIESRDVIDDDFIDDVTNRRAICTLPIGHEPLNHLVSEILSIKVADTQADIRIDTSIDNKGRLKLAAREPTETCTIFYYVNLYFTFLLSWNVVCSLAQLSNNKSS